jgi:hypothetical protein
MPTLQSGLSWLPPDPTRRNCRLPGKPRLHAFSLLPYRFEIEADDDNEP